MNFYTTIFDFYAVLWRSTQALWQSTQLPSIILTSSLPITFIIDSRTQKAVILIYAKPQPMAEEAE